MTDPGFEPGTLSVLDSRDKTNYTNRPVLILFETNIDYV